MTFSTLILAAITVGVWNGEWFPSGRAEHRAAPEIEQGAIRAAGRMIREGLNRVDPAGTNDLILCFNEFRRDTDGESVAEMLCREIARTNLRVAVVSGYRRRDRFDQQQDVIATTLPVVGANWSVWKRMKNPKDVPPRGYAHALLVLEPAVTASVYCVHLKSNYGQTSEAIAKANREKRSRAIEQLLAQEKPRRGKKPAPMILAGDFNADKWNHAFAKETIFSSLEAAGFVEPLGRLPLERRVTHPGTGRFGDSTLDYIFVRSLDFDGEAAVISAEGVSDHSPVFVNIKL